MNRAFLLAALGLITTFLPAANADDRTGLPPCRTSAFMGQPGDGIRSDLGHHISGTAVQGRPARSRAASGNQMGLPACRNSAYMGQPGDGIRSDLGNSIYGQPAMRQAAGGRNPGLPPVRNSAYMGQPGDGIRSDLGQRISGTPIYVPAQHNRQLIYRPQAQTMKYPDYTQR